MSEIRNTVLKFEGKDKDLKDLELFSKNSFANVEFAFCDKFGSGCNILDFAHIKPDFSDCANHLLQYLEDLGAYLQEK